MQQTTQQKMQTVFIGINPHRETHTFIALSPFGEYIKDFTFHNSPEGFEKALSHIQQITATNQLAALIGMEDTGGNGEFCARYFTNKGYTVKTVSALLVDRARRKNIHPEKSDPQDAEEVARVLLTRSDRLPAYTISQNRDLAKDFNLLVKDREELVKEQTRLKNKLHGALHTSWGTLYKTVHRKDTFGKQMLEFWHAYPAAIDFKYARSKQYNKPECLVAMSADMVPPVSDIHRLHIRRIVKRLKALREDVWELDQLLKSHVMEKAAYLMTLRGCGAVTAAKLHAELNDINRFPHDNQLVPHQLTIDEYIAYRIIGGILPVYQYLSYEKVQRHLDGRRASAVARHYPQVACCGTQTSPRIHTLKSG